MREFINGIIRADGEQWAGFIFLSFIGFTLFLAAVALSSDHKVRCYYPKIERSNIGVEYLIMGDINWAEDIRSVSFTNSEEQLEALNQLDVCGA